MGLSMSGSGVHFWAKYESSGDTANTYKSGESERF